jgi:uncharacterized protein YcbK (DUF882 family)
MTGFQFKRPPVGGRPQFISAAILVLAALVAIPASAASATTSGTGTGTGVTNAADSLVGRSKKLRARFVPKPAGKRGGAIPILESHFGDSSNLSSVAFIPMLPFTQKLAGKIGEYRIGYWPAERRKLRGPSYANPAGFIEVTRENQDTRVSEHFRLRDFLTHDQQKVWPKYLVLREELIDKLELVIEDLKAHGVHVEHMTVMSGFRTPQYNDRGVGKKCGRAKDSRHQYGDAADVFVDNDRNGRMDDLNRDGVVDAKDAAVIMAAVERIEQAHPQLTGGVGLYRSTRSHGPFAHIDVRGSKARWGRS